MPVKSNVLRARFYPMAYAKFIRLYSSEISLFLDTSRYYIPKQYAILLANSSKPWSLKSFREMSRKIKVLLYSKNREN